MHWTSLASIKGWEFQVVAEKSVNDNFYTTLPISYFTQQHHKYNLDLTIGISEFRRKLIYRAIHA
jgi:hypothetical protein